ncbi:MAG: tyrosine-type recombinase/integrase [Anaerolineaceae bacterium]|nr:tyrosine-type recombinase/integrase [Anaerolineaceae bacterium]
MSHAHLTPSPATSAAILLPDDANKDTRSRLKRFSTWLDTTGRPWHAPDLAAYRDALRTQGLSPISVRAHLATVRGRYAALLKDPAVLDRLEAAAYAACLAEGFEPNPANIQAAVGRLTGRIQNAIHPDAAPMTVITRQDRPDDETVRLTAAQASALLAAPGVDALLGLRDTALIALMLCTGIREAELVALDVPDLRQRLGGTLALHVRDGKGAKERLIPYGDLDFALVIVEAWLRRAAITVGPVFRGFYKGGWHIRDGRLHVRAINQVMDRYPIVVDGIQRTVNPHDLRRTYARRLYEAGVDLLAIQQNLGHADHKTTELYIGRLDVGARKPPALYTFDLGMLRQSR